MSIFTTFRLCAPIALALLLAGCTGEEISRREFEEQGKTWPLTVGSGTLTCNGSGVFFEDPDGRVYAVNGIARKDRPGVPHLDEITAVDEGTLRILRAAGNRNPFEPRLPIGEILAIGLELC